MFGRFRKKDKDYTAVAREAQAGVAALTEMDKAPLRAALTAPRSRSGLGVLSLRERAPAVRGSDEVETIPQSAEDTMIVASPVSWRTYQRTAAFLCEPGRVFRPVRFVAYSVDGELQREVPRIIAVRDDVPFDAAEQRRLMWSATELDLRLADVIATARRLGLASSRHQVYLLTAPGQAGHVTLPAEVARRASRRRGRAFGSRQGSLPAAAPIGIGA